MADNKEIMVRFIEECWNLRNKTICAGLLSADYEHYMPGTEEPSVGPAAYLQLVQGFLEGFPDTRFEIEDVFGEGERVCLVWTARGTHKGVFNGIQPTNNSVVIRGVGIARIVDGLIVKVVSMFDNDSFTKQLVAPAEKTAVNWQKATTSAA